MRNNLTLFAILVLLLVGTYFFQEKRGEEQFHLSLIKDRLLVEDINSIEFNGVIAQKKDERWYSDEKLLSYNDFRLIEKKLHEIKVVKTITGDKALFFKDPFTFKVNRDSFELGELSFDRQSFYISKNNEVFLAVIDGGSIELARHEEDIAQIKLNELKSALSKSLSELIEKQLFRYYPNLPMDEVVIEAEGHLPFSLNFVQNKTTPAPIQGVSEHKELLKKFRSLLTQMNIRREVEFSEKLKFKMLGELKFISKDKAVEWELWIKDPKSADAYLIDNESERAFLMVGGSLRVFFIQLQDYWDKKVIPANFFKSFNRLSMEFIQDDRAEVVTLMNREPFGFEASKFKVDETNMNALLEFVFNLGEKDQAERVSVLSKSEKKQLLSGSHLRVELMGQELLFWRKKEELIVVNLTQGFKAHFNLISENFNAEFEDVLK